MPQITENEAMAMLQAGSLDQYNDDYADLAIALIKKKAPSWAPSGFLRADSPLNQVLQVVATLPPNMTNGLQTGRQDVLEYLTAKRTIWELGVSLAALGLANVRNAELQRLTTDNFWTSHYLLYLSALLKSKGLVVHFVDETKHPTPDIKVDEWFVECKERNCDTPCANYFGGMVAKSKAKFNRNEYRPGIVAYDIVPDNLFAPEGVALENHYKQIGKMAFTELVKLKGVEAAIITIRRLLSRSGDKVGFPTVWLCLLKDSGHSKKFREIWSNAFQFIWSKQDFG